MRALAKRKALEVDLERPILIIGVGRSGTSLLQSMLNAHPELCFPPETHFFRRYVAPLAEDKTWTTRDRRRLAQRLSKDQSFARAGIVPRELLDAPESAGGPAGIFRALLRHTALLQGKSRVGDKDPKNIDSLRSLRRVFPGAFVIHMIRDPRDVLLSRTKAAWSAHRPWWVHPLIYREQMRRGRSLGEELFGERYIELRYEELIAAPQASLRRICERVDLSWTPAMLQFGDSAARLVDPREMSWKSETLGPLLTHNSGKWREGLSRWQTAYTEEICAETFEAFGYVRAQPARVSLRALAFCMRGAMSFAYDLKHGEGA